MAGLSADLLAAVDARIAAKRQGLPPPAVLSSITPQPVALNAQQPAHQQPDYRVRGATPSAQTPQQPATHPAIAQMDAKNDAEGAASGERLKARLDALQQPIPYAVRGAGSRPVADLVTQSQQQAQDIRPPEWWAEGLAGGGTAVLNAIWYLFSSDEYDQRMIQDPIYRELRRSALVARYEAELRRAAALAKSGQEDHAKASYREVERLRSLIGRIDAGQ